MQAENADTVAAEREADREAEREMVHDETAPLMREMRAMRAEINALRAEFADRLPKTAA